LAENLESVVLKMEAQDDSTAAEVMLKACEDFAGLWEILPIVRANGASADDATAIGQRVVRELYERGWITFAWGSPQPNEADTLNTDEVSQILNDDKFWREEGPLSGRLVWIYATPDGERWVHARVL
jgi:hypothetical protein